MQITNVWSVICQKAVIDNKTNLLTMIDVLEKINLNLDFKGIPLEFHKDLKNPKNNKALLSPINFTLVSYWQVNKHSKSIAKQIFVEILDPNNISLVEKDFSIPFEEESLFKRTLIEIPGFPVTVSGIYKVRLKEKNGKEFKVLTVIPVLVNLTFAE